MPTLDVLFTLARTGVEIVIVTSTLSITEVAFAPSERTRGRLDPMIEATLDALWSDPAVRLIPLSPAIARAARQLVRGALVTGPRLRPPDAIHLATARRFSVAEFQTYDATLHKLSGRFGFPIHEPSSIPPTPGSKHP